MADAGGAEPPRDRKTVLGPSLKHRSHELTGKTRDEDENSWLKRMGTRAFVRMGGWGDDDFDKPVITVAAPYTNASSCNHQFDQLAKAVADAVEVKHSPVPLSLRRQLTLHESGILWVPFSGRGWEAVHLPPAGDHGRHDHGRGGHEVQPPQPRHGGGEWRRRPSLCTPRTHHPWIAAN